MCTVHKWCTINNKSFSTWKWGEKVWRPAKTLGKICEHDIVQVNLWKVYRFNVSVFLYYMFIVMDRVEHKAYVMLDNIIVYVSDKDCWYGITDWERKTSNMACSCVEGFRKVFHKGTAVLPLSSFIHIIIWVHDRFIYYYYHHHHHLLYAGYLHLYSWDKLCP